MVKLTLSVSIAQPKNWTAFVFWWTDCGRGGQQGNGELDLWLKEIAPSTGLRQWYHGNEGAGKWDEFKARYLAELKNNTALAQLHELTEKHDKVTLLFSVNDAKHNHAAILKALISCQLKCDDLL